MTIELDKQQSQGEGEGQPERVGADNALIAPAHEALSSYYATRDRLNKAKEDLEARRDGLKRGFIEYKHVDGSQVTLSLFGLPSPTEGPFPTPQEVKQVIASNWQELQTNPVVIAIHQSLLTRQELQQELTNKGELPAVPGSDQPVKQAAFVNRRLVTKVSRQHPTLARVIGSPWLIVAGLVLFVLLYGQSLIYMVSGGSAGADYVPVKVRITPTATIKATATSANTTSAGVNARPVAANTRSSNLAAYYPLAAQVQVQQTDLDTTVTPAALTLIPTPAPTPSDSSSSDSSTATTSTDNQNQNQQTSGSGADIGIIPPKRVGQLPVAAGGNNGPHGAFQPPSRLSVSAIGITAVPIARAQTQEDADGQVNVIWPQPGQTEVSQIGVYPGQLGNCVLMGNQAQLGLLRKAQVGDYITLVDRSGNQYPYKFVPVSPAGLPEMVVDLDDSTDSEWLFEQNNDIAEVTILVPLPQQTPVIAIAENGAGAGTAGVITTTTTTNTTASTRLDDLTTSKRLAYRAVLARYAPAAVTPNGYAVEVPASAWTPAAALAREEQAAIPTATPTPTPTPAVTSSNTVVTSNYEATATASAVITPNPSPNSTDSSSIPSMPDTGLGGSNWSQLIGRKAGSLIDQLVPDRQLPTSLTVTIRPQ